jgi:tRNA dimethylallyltransferase
LKYDVLFLTPSGPFDSIELSSIQLKSDEYRQWLYNRINMRVGQMFEEWLERELQSLLAQGYTFWNPGFISIGYQEFEPYMRWEQNIEEVKKMIQQHSRNYAKRQLTWFQKYLNIWGVEM